MNGSYNQSQRVLKCLEVFQLSKKDMLKLYVHLSFSLALKYNERVVPTFEDLAKGLRFEAPCELLIGLLTPEILRRAELEVLQQLNFRVGEGALPENSKVGQIHEKVIYFMQTHGLQALKDKSDLSEYSLNKVAQMIEQAAIHFSLVNLLIKTSQDSDLNASESICSSIYLSFKLYEKKSGLRLLTKPLFDSMC